MIPYRMADVYRFRGRLASQKRPAAEPISIVPQNEKGARRAPFSAIIAVYFFTGSLINAGIASRMRVKAFWMFSMELAYEKRRYP